MQTARNKNAILDEDNENYPDSDTFVNKSSISDGDGGTSDGDSSNLSTFEELQQAYLEVEPVKSLSTRSNGSLGSVTVDFRPTYRAELAMRGYLVRETLGYGSYSKVKLGVDVKCMCNK